MKLRMKRGWCLLLSVCMLAVFLPSSRAEDQPGTPTGLTEGTPGPADAQNKLSTPVPASYDKAEYSENDVNVINAMIDKNGLSVAKDDPAGWSFVTWGSDTPKRITELDVYGTYLTGSLDVSGLSGLQDLDCSSNQLSSLHVSGLSGLQNLDCNSNQLSGLDVSGLSGLRYLSCGDNQLTSLALGGLNEVGVLFCSNNQLTSLNLTGLPAGIGVDCEGNDLVQLITPDGDTLTVGRAENGFACINRYGRRAAGQAEIKAYPKRGYRFHEWNNGSADNPHSFQLSDSATITPNFIGERDTLYHAGDIDFLEGLITDQQLAGKKGIRFGYPDTYPAVWQDDGAAQRDKRVVRLDVQYLGLTGDLDVRGLSALQRLYCYNNQLTGLDVSGLSGLQHLYCYNNQLTSLNISGLTMLGYFDCNNNQLTELDISGLSVSPNFRCHFNPLARLKLRNGKSIEIHVTGSGQPWLESFDISTVHGIYTAKPAPGYGAAWSKLTGCTEKGGRLSFDLNFVDTVSADLTFFRTAPLIADPALARITGTGTGSGIQEGMTVEKGGDFSFTANVVETSEPNNPVTGDIRYMPESWAVNPSGDFATGYTQRFSTKDMALGGHTLRVTYRKQAYNGTEWAGLGETIEKTLDFTLVEQGTPPVTPPKGDTSGGNASGGNPGTGDSGYAWYFLGLAVAGGGLLLLTRRKRTA